MRCCTPWGEGLRWATCPALPPPRMEGGRACHGGSGSETGKRAAAGGEGVRLNSETLEHADEKVGEGG
ncbi:MAG: hypothetical protein RLZZ142_1074, partial [Verrucomicrobiota bacterium]